MQTQPLLSSLFSSLRRRAQLGAPAVALGGLLLSACSPEPAAEVEVEAPVLEAAVHEDGDVVVTEYGQYDVIRLRDALAQAFFNVLDEAGGLDESVDGGLTYLYGNTLACVSNGTSAACNIYADKAYTDEAGFAVTFYGRRFSSAASEVFGAIARAQGTAPSDVNYVEEGRFLCSKDQSYVGCGILDASDVQPEPEPEPEPEMAALEVQFDGLESLGADYVYEGWLIVDGEALPAGRFDVVDDEPVVFEFDPALRETASMYVLTIEPAVGDDPAPSSTHVVAGVFQQDRATLSIDHPAALGDDFTDAAGEFILATPSSDMEGTGTQGVWFLDPTAGPGPSLDLPTLPAGWAYEGWVVTEDGPVSTGRFLDADREDDDGAGPAAGPLASPPFPGQDFIDPALDLTGAAVVISIEPQPDNSPAPFAFKPLMQPSAEGVVGQLQDMTNRAHTLASGLATWR